MLYQILSVCQEKGGGCWVVYIPVLVTTVLTEDKKKYSLLNKSSLEKQKEPTFRKREGTCLGWVGVGHEGHGTRGNPVFPLRPCRLFQFGKSLSCAQTGLYSLPSQTACRSPGWRDWCKDSILRGKQEITEHKGSAPVPL